MNFSSTTAAAAGASGSSIQGSIVGTAGGGDGGSCFSTAESGQTTVIENYDDQRSTRTPKDESDMMMIKELRETLKREQDLRKVGLRKVPLS